MATKKNLRLKIRGGVRAAARLLSLMAILATLSQQPANAAMAGGSTLDQQAYQLVSGLRCLVCSGQSVADSNAPWAEDVRSFVTQKLSEGWSRQQVMDYLIARYGQDIAMTTPKQPSTLALWMVPPLLLLLLLLWGKKQLRPTGQEQRHD